MQTSLVCTQVPGEAKARDSSALRALGRDGRKWRQLHSLAHPRRTPAQCGNARHAQQRSTFSAIRGPKWSRGCTCDQEFASRIHESVAMCTICHGVDQKWVGKCAPDSTRCFGIQIWVDAMADRAPRGVLVYTKRKLFIASATPWPLRAPNC